MLFPEFFQKPADDALVKIITAQVVVSRSCQDFDRIAVDIQNADIKSAAAQIIDHDFAWLSFIETVSQRSGSRLVDDPQNIQACNQAGVFGSLALRV